jgi:DNA-binding IclR family transcriptional regulator
MAGYPGTQAVRRAVRLLKAFDDAHPRRGLAELADVLELNKTTAFRLLAALEGEGLVARAAPAEGYRLGPEAIAIGARALRATDLRAAAHANLEALARAVGETATIEILVDAEVLIVDEVLGGRLVGSVPGLGTRWPAHATSTGKVLLAARSNLELPATLTRYTDRTITSREALEKDFAIVRARGYAVAVDELEMGYLAVGAPVRNHDDEVVAALSAGGPRSRMTADRIPTIIDAVRAHARAISAGLGAPVPRSES